MQKNFFPLGGFTNILKEIKEIFLFNIDSSSQNKEQKKTYFFY